jgi:Flp pilus assembly protein TadG
MGKVTRRRERRGERGAAAVEFALVLPILLLVVFGIVNYGFVFAQQIALNNGARQAARFAVVEGPTCADVIAEFQNGAQTIGMPEASVPTPVISGCGAGQPCEGSTPANPNVTVSFTHESAWVVPFPPFGSVIPNPTLTGDGVMRCEFS